MLDMRVCCQDTMATNLNKTQAEEAASAKLRVCLSAMMKLQMHDKAFYATPCIR